MRSEHARLGRPLRGDVKRIRLSFTLHPREALWLREQALDWKKSRSETLELIIRQAQNISPPEQLPIPLPRKEIAEFCEEHGVRKLSLFGSVLRGDFGPESDIDVLVEFKRDRVPSLFELVPMQQALRQIFEGREIDLKTPMELSRYFRDEVLSSAHVLYEEDE